MKPTHDELIGAVAVLQSVLYSAFEYLSVDPPPAEMVAIGDDDRAKWLRALIYLAAVDEQPNFSKAARNAGIKRGTVAAWLSRFPELKAAADRYVAKPAVVYSNDQMERAVKTITTEDIEHLRAGDVPDAELLDVILSPEDRRADAEQYVPPVEEAAPVVDDGEVRFNHTVFLQSYFYDGVLDDWILDWDRRGPPPDRPARMHATKRPSKAERRWTPQERFGWAQR